MYCKNCGKEINDNAEICIHCGARVAPAQPRVVDNPSNFAGLISCCFPLVGLILYFIWKDDKPKSAKVVCNWMLAGLACWVIFYVLAFFGGLLSEF